MPALAAPPRQRRHGTPDREHDGRGSLEPREAATRLSVGAYAAFCAELSVFPGRRETFQRYGLASPQEAINLASAWQERFLGVPAEFDKWQRLHRLYVDHCRTKGRPEVAS